MSFTKRHRDLALANGAGLLVLTVVLLLGWWDAAAFGLAVLVILDLMVFLRKRSAHEPEAPHHLTESGSEAERAVVEQRKS